MLVQPLHSALSTSKHDVCPLIHMWGLSCMCAHVRMCLVQVCSLHPSTIAFFNKIIQMYVFMYNYVFDNECETDSTAAVLPGRAPPLTEPGPPCGMLGKGNFLDIQRLRIIEHPLTGPSRLEG